MAFDRVQDWFAELRQLDVGSVGIWPRPAKAVAFAAVFCCALLAGKFFYLSGKQAAVTTRIASETELKREYERKALPAAHLDSVRTRHSDAAAEFEALLRQLPKDTEVPGLIEDISRAALRNALVIESIDLETERAVGFYMELPIGIAVRGSFHDIGAFVSDVGALSRIVTLHDFELAPEEHPDQTVGSMAAAACDGDDPEPTRCSSANALRMTILAKTYSYLPRSANLPEAQT